MTDTQKFFLSATAGIIVFAAIHALYYLEDRAPNKALIGSTAAVAAVGAWYFLGRKKKS
jgi:hypothetical protein